MPQLVIPGAAQVAIKMSCSGQDVVNVIGLGLAGNVSAEEVGNIVKTAWEANLGPLAYKPSVTKMVSYKVVKLDVGGSVAEIASAKAGGGTSTSLSTMASSALIVLGGGSRDRSTRGRLYHGPLAENAIDPDGRTILTSYRADLETCYKKFRADIAATGHSWSVLSRKNSRAYPIDIVSCASIIATQRRRLR